MENMNEMTAEVMDTMVLSEVPGTTKTFGASFGKIALIATGVGLVGYGIYRGAKAIGTKIAAKKAAKANREEIVVEECEVVEE
jgi:hypothetical protein